MPRSKDLKRLVRARMTKTGEAYTTALAQVTKKTKASATRVNYAELAGMTDEIIREKTGRAWHSWVEVLDGHDAATMAHGDIAKIVSGKYNVASWWTQAVTVGYERIKGLRVRGQRRDGTYEMSKSRTFSVPISTLYAAWANAKTRRKWLSEAEAKVRSTVANKSMRIGWPGGAIVIVGFIAKGAAKSTISVTHTKLADREAANQLKQYWSDQLDALGEVLAER